jgi:hypothetical protein
MTLAEQAKLERDPLRKGIIMGLLEESYVMQTLPFEGIGGLGISVVKWQTLPTVGFRKISQAFSESTGTTQQQSESVYILGGDIDVDVVLNRDKNTIMDPRALQTKMETKAIAYAFNDFFINGDQATTPDGFDGLKVRVSNLASRQTIDAASLDLSTGTARDTNAQTLLDYLHQLIYVIEGHKADALYMNDTTYLYVESVVRRAGLLSTTKDSFDRTVSTFMGVPLIDMGVKADQTTKIIADNHDGSSGITSIYACRFGVGEYLHGIEEFKLDVRDLGELPDKSVLRTRTEWPVGLANWNDRSMGRLKGLKIA